MRVRKRDEKKGIRVRNRNRNRKEVGMRREIGSVGARIYESMYVCERDREREIVREREREG